MLTRLLWTVAVLGAALWIATVFMHPILQMFGFRYSIASLASWGDSFGGISALFAAVGFAAVVWTLQLQQKQNNVQQAQNNESLKDQHRQRFESSYFELLRLLRETRSAVTYKYSLPFAATRSSRSRTLKKGTWAFMAAWQEAEHWLMQLKTIDNQSVSRMYETRIHQRHESNFGPYFRLVYTILRRIKEDPVLAEAEKVKYGNLLRSQLNSYELALLGLNGTSSISADMGSLIIHFRLLKYIPPKSVRRATLQNLYPPSAFQGREG